MTVPDAKRFQTDLEGKIELEIEILDRLYNAEPDTVAEGTPLVLDLRGLAGFVVFLDGGTATWQECDASGTTVAGSSSNVVASGARVETPWAYVLITATTADCVVSTV